MASVRSKLKTMLKNGETIVAPGAYDPVSARVVQTLGFSTVYTGGYMSGAHLAVSEPLMTMTEQVEVARKVANAVDLPVICDAGAGYGDPVHATRCVRVYEDAGLAGMHIEDQQFPKRCGHLSGKTLIERDEMVAKIHAAVAARRDPDFVIIARTDARAVIGLDEAIERATAYVAAGADAIFPEALETAEEFAEFAVFARTIDVPLIANMTEFGKSPLLSVSELDGMGYAAVLFPLTIFRVAMKAVENALSQLADVQTQQNFIDQMQTRSELYDLLNYNDFDRRDQTYFGE